LNYFRVRKQVFPQLFIDRGILPPDPFQNHRGMFFFLVPIVRKDLLKGGIVGGVYPLLVPVDRFKFLDQTSNGTVHVPRIRGELSLGLVKSFGCHWTPSLLKFLIEHDRNQNDVLQGMDLWIDSPCQNIPGPLAGLIQRSSWSLMLFSHMDTVGVKDTTDRSIRFAAMDALTAAVPRT
jgi:hypothetical protein